MSRVHKLEDRKTEGVVPYELINQGKAHIRSITNVEVPHLEELDEEILESKAEEPIPEVDPQVGTSIEELEREAFEKGFAAGEEAGFEIGLKKAEVTFQGLEGIFSTLTAYKKTLAESCEKDMIDMVTNISRKVIHQELETNSDVIVGIVREALKYNVAGGEVTVKVNPKDLEVLSEHREEIIALGEGLKGLTIEGSEGVSRGGCLIDTNYGEIEATMEGFFEELEEKLKGE